MDSGLFSNRSPGGLTPIKATWGDDHAFLPDPLPPTWQFPERLWPLLAEAKHLLGILDGIGRTLPNPAILLRPQRDREAILSSEMEGTFASVRELLLFELEPRQPRSEDDPANRIREVANYAKALDFAMDSELPLCLRLIRQLHEQLMTGVRGRDKRPGMFRQVLVGVRTGAYIPPPPERILDFLDSLEDYGNVKKTRFDPLVDCFLFHYQFEAIHPFQDGNGRVGRLLLTYMIQQKCKLTKPWLYMSEFFESHRDEYYGGLFNISTEGNWAEWIEYCIRGVVEQANATIQRCEKLLVVESEFKKRLKDVGGNVRLNSIVEHIFSSPFVRLASLPEKLGVTYATAKKDVERLVDAEILKEMPFVYPKYFYAPEIFKIAYDELPND